MQNGHSILGAGKELEQALPKFWSLVSLFPPNTQQKVKVMNPLASKDKEFLNRLEKIEKENQEVQYSSKI